MSAQPLEAGPEFVIWCFSYYSLAASAVSRASPCSPLSNTARALRFFASSGSRTAPSEAEHTLRQVNTAAVANSHFANALVRYFLPPDLFEQYAGLSFWKDGAGSAANVIRAQTKKNGKD